MQIFPKMLLASTMLFFGAATQTQVMNAQTNAVKMTNPLLQKSTLQYQAPPFNLINDEHFKPAFDFALKVHDEEIEKIANNPAKPATNTPD